MRCLTRIALTCLMLLAIASASAQEHSTDASGEPEPRRSDDWLIGDFDQPSRWTTLALGLGLGIYLGTADTSDIRDLGDITQLVPGAFGLTSAWLTGDRIGLKQFGLAAVTTAVSWACSSLLFTAASRARGAPQVRNS